jgi:branched-chain amino acid transport system substrate-binding protein
MRVPVKFVNLGLALVLLVTACGGGSTASPTVSGTGPIRIALMGIFSGANFTPGADNAFKLAVDEINAGGGVAGRQIEYREFDTGITPQGAIAATSLALQYQPTLFIGYGISAGLKASIDAVNSAGVPVIQGTLASLTSPKSLGSDLTFRMYATTAQFATAADGYLLGTLGVKKMMIINTADSAPTEGGQYIQADADKAGVTTMHRSVSPSVTDLTEPVLAAQGMNAGAIWEWGYATTDALVTKTAAANGFTGNIMTFTAGSAARNGLIPTSLLTDKVNGVNPCAPYALTATNPQAKTFVAAYKAKFGIEVNDSVSSTYYDAVYLFKEALLAAGSSDPKAVAAKLKTIDHHGICGEEKADANHNLIHDVQILKFTGGTPSLVKNIQNIPSPF